VNRNRHTAFGVRNFLAAAYGIPHLDEGLQRRPEVLVDRDDDLSYRTHILDGQAARAVFLLGWMGSTPESFGWHGEMILLCRRREYADLYPGGGTA
jgi:hypothetical protein